MIGILSDAHGNGEALEQGLNLLAANGAKSFVFLGDSVGYIPSPKALNLLSSMAKTNELLCIKGNHEDMLLAAAPPKNDSVYQIALTKSQLSDDDLAFAASWPDTLEIDYPAGKTLYVHGSPTDNLNGYIYPDSDLSKICENSPYRFIFCGHTHRPFISTHGKTTVINVGSCGLPRDVGKLGSAALFDQETGNVRILRFDIDLAVRNILKNGVTLDESVIQLFDRKSQHFVGEYVGA